MRKFFFILTLFIIISSTGYSQSEYQKELVNNFFKYHGAKIIAGLGHYTLKPQQFSIEVYGHTYYVMLTYYSDNFSKYFNCTYRVEMNSTGEMISLTSTSCGAPGLYNCFESATAIKNLIAYFTKDEEAWIAKFYNKTSEEISIPQLCLGQLYYSWISNGYYSKY
ncbi:MAG: hypothetical protein QM725_16825 [Lacibacter sp.]